MLTPDLFSDRGGKPDPRERRKSSLENIQFPHCGRLLLVGATLPPTPMESPVQAF